MKVYVVFSYSRGIHGIRDTYEKALKLKEKADLDLGLSGSLYTSCIEEYIVE